MIIRRRLLSGVPSVAADLPASTPSSQFISRISAPGAPRQTLYETLINSLVSTGVWPKLDILYVYGAADAATALTNLKSGLFSGTAMNGIPFTANVGYGITDATATTHYLKSGYTPSTAGGNWIASSACAFVWYKDNRAADSRCLSASLGASAVYLYPRHTFADQIYGLINSAGTPSLNDDNSHSNPTGTTGLLSLNLLGGTMEFKVNTTSIRSVTPSFIGAAVDSELTFFNSPGSGETSNNCIRAAGAASGLTAQNIADLQSALSTYLGAI